MNDEQRARLRVLSEDAAAFTPAGDGWTRVVTERYVAEIGPDPDPQMNVVSRLRLDSLDLAAVVEQVRALYRRHDRTANTWEIASSASPAGLRQRLLELGMRPADPPSMLGLGCADAPLSKTPGVEVERVQTDVQLAEVATVYRDGDGWEPSDQWLRGAGVTRRFLARIGGEAVATADLTPMKDDAVFLGGAVTLPRARGRGAYRALVAARWRDAMAEGRTLMVTQSEPMSQPILLRLGFEVVGEIHVLEDTFSG